MKKLRLSIVGLVAILTLFFNIERLSFQDEILINIPFYVYAMEFAIVAFTLSIPFIRRLPLHVLMIGGLVLYLAFNTLIDSRLLIGGIYTYISITEIVLLVTSLFFAHTIACSLQEFEEAVENITFGDIKKRVKRQSEVTDNVETEVMRSRRYGHPMSVVVVEPDPQSIQASLHRMVQEVQQAMMSRYVFLGLARIVARQIRCMDMVMEQDNKGRLIILCPETKPEGAVKLVDRIRHIAHEKLGLSFGWSIASFPDEALTFDNLVQHAVKQLPTQPNQLEGAVSHEDTTDGPLNGLHIQSSAALQESQNLATTEGLK